MATYSPTAAIPAGDVKLQIRNHVHSGSLLSRAGSNGVPRHCGIPSVRHLSQVSRRPRTLVVRAGSQSSNSSASVQGSKLNSSNSSGSVPTQQLAESLEDAEEEVEESWLDERIDSAVELTATFVRAVPGPRVTTTNVPWLLAVPLAYLGITFVWSVFSFVRKKNTPQAKRRRQVRTSDRHAESAGWVDANSLSNTEIHKQICEA